MVLDRSPVPLDTGQGYGAALPSSWSARKFAVASTRAMQLRARWVSSRGEASACQPRLSHQTESLVTSPSGDRMRSPEPRLMLTP
jgi:hypothetical protein